ncbi:MAG TPA: TonB-dependent receptor [Thermoanaerobaculia bacterium]|nr:TonB-dependent receptor [Thermoanaerobaculia bacterium]
MKRCPPSRPFAAVVTAILLAALFAVSAFGQAQFGNIYGKVQAKDGTMLPGVTVTLSGVGAPQVFISDSEGNFRFLNLSPSSDYQLKAELTGFGTAVRQGVSVNVGRNSDLTLVLTPSVEQSITVTADAPLIDPRKTGTGTTVSRVELEQIPTGRDPWVVMGQTPGVLLDRVNIGGSESGQQDVIVAKGASDVQKTFNLDGVNITDVGALGSTPTYYDFDSFEEIQVTTGGSDPRIQTPGAQLNMVTKRGTNEYKGAFRYFMADRDWQASAVSNAEAQSQGIIAGNKINTNQNWSTDIGGPILRDKIWLWGSYAKQDVRLFILQTAGQAEPTKDNTILKDWNGKLNFQPWSSNSGTYLYTYGNKLKFGRGAGSTRPTPETTWDQSGPSHMYKLEDTQIFNQSLYMTALYAHILSPFQFIPEGGNVQPYRDEDGVFHRSHSYYSTRRPQDSYRLDGSYFFKAASLDNELKFGFGYRKAPVTSSSIYPATGVMGDASTGDPDICPDCTGTALLTRPGAADYVVKYNDFYLGDTLTHGNLTVQGGLRFDQQKSRNGTVVSGANPLAPDVLKELTFGPDTRDLKWSSVSPRLGFTYTLGSQKKTLIRGSYNQYVDQLGGASLVAGSNPFVYANGVYYFWKDLNNDKFVTRNEILFDLGPYGGYYLGDFEHPNDVSAAARIDYGMKVPKTHELIAGFEREIMSNFSVGADYTYRRFNDFWWVNYEKTPGAGDFYTTSDFVRTTDLKGTLPDGRSFSVPNYKLKVPFSGLAVVTTRPGYHQTYNGIDLYATKRMSHHWMLRGSISVNDRKQHISDSGIFDPTHTLLTTNNQYGCTSCDGSVAVDKSYGTHTTTYINAKWSSNISALFELPWAVNLGANLSAREGYPVPYYYRVNNLDGLGNKNVLIDDVDGERTPTMYNLDLRVAKDFRLGPVTIGPAIELFNVTNQRTILSREPRLYRSIANRATGEGTPNGAANFITEFQSPRIFRLSARIQF